MSEYAFTSTAVDFHNFSGPLTSLFGYSPEAIDPRLLELTSDIDPQRPDWSDLCNRDFSSVCEEVCTDVVAVPFLSRTFCDTLAAFASSVGHFKIDVAKDAFAAPEMKLRDISPMVENVIRRAIVHHLAPIIYARWRVVPSLIHPPFLIQYKMDSQVAMGQHHDMHSDVTISVGLNDSFEGGGLYFVRQNFNANDLAVGTAVLFPGRVTHLHEARPITAGLRSVLTVWTEHRQ